MEKKIKIFVDCHWFDHSNESAAIYLRGLYRHLLEDERFEFFFAAQDTEHLHKQLGNPRSANILRFKSASRFYRLGVDAPEMIGRYKIDVSHFQYSLPLVRNSLEIVTIHDLLFLHFPELFPWTYRVSKKFLFRRSALRADIVSTVSNFSAASIQKFFHISPERIKVVPNGVSPEFFQYAGDRDSRVKFDLNKYILLVSRVEPRKNHLTLLKAFTKSSLPSQGFKLVFVGRKDIEVNELRDYQSSLSAELSSKVVWIEGVSFEDLLSLYFYASVFVYPSLGEGFGIPPLEAGAMRVRTLCSKATAMSDFDFFEGDLFDPADVEELQRKLTDKVNDRDSSRLDRIADAIGTRYNWQDIAESFAATIVELHSRK